MIITIDGLAGSGKSTVARKLANKLGVIHVDSGALFRSVSLRAKQLGISSSDDQATTSLAKSLKFSFQLDQQGNTKLLVDDLPVGDEIRSAEIGELASQIAVLPNLREVLANVQREIGRRNSIVLEGRDAGTVVFPDAQFKFYLDANLDVRTERRFQDFALIGNREAGNEDQASFDQLKQQIEKRDLRDSSREVAPTFKADEAVLVDTSKLSIDQVVEKLVAVINNNNINQKNI